MVDHEVRRDSLQRRWQTGARTLLPYAVLASFFLYALRGAASDDQLLIWFSVVATTVMWRAVSGRYSAARLQIASSRRLRLFEMDLRAYLIVTNLTMGSIYWIVEENGSHETHLLITIASCLYAIGLLAYHAADVRGYAVGLGCNLGQAIIFWLVSSDYSSRWVIAAMLSTLTGTLAYQAVANSMRFRSKIRNRIARQLLLIELEEEKRIALKAALTAEKASTAKASFFAAASHDLRQPIQALTLLVETLSPMLTDPTAKRLMTGIKGTAASLEALFGDILRLARFDADAVKVNQARFSADVLLHRISEEFTLQARQKNLSFEIQIEPSEVFSDPLLLERAVRNLLSNAVQHTERGTVTLAAQKTCSRLKITVQDTGPGIPIEHQSSIFDEFVQLPNTSAGRDLGTGLGLAIVRRIDSLIGLGLCMESEVGRGTNFNLSVPLALSRSAPIFAEYVAGNDPCKLQPSKNSFGS